VDSGLHHGVARLGGGGGSVDWDKRREVVVVGTDEWVACMGHVESVSSV